MNKTVTLSSTKDPMLLRIYISLHKAVSLKTLATQPVFTCSKSTMEITEQCKKSVQIILSVNISQTLSYIICVKDRI